MAFNRELNLVGLKCPMPIVELNRAMRELGNGDEIQVTANDPAFPLDVEAWCRRTGQSLLDLRQQEEKYVALLRKTS
jgi:TusA-related sulfurtransferase